MKRTFWTREESSFAMALQDHGWSASEIAEKMSARYKKVYTRDAILGRLFRMKRPEHCKAYDDQRPPRRREEIRV
jgi:hypothetical protein